MSQAYIVDALRIAGGRRNGRLSGFHPTILSAFTLDAIIDRTGIDPKVVDDVIMGCVSQAGEQSVQVGRNAVLASKLPQSVPAVTIDRQCGSSQQAIVFAAQAVMSGTQDIVIAAGVESMSRVPMGSPQLRDTGADSLSDRIKSRYNINEFNQFTGAEMIAKKWGFSRDICDEFALESHKRAIAATESGAFKNEIIPLEINSPDGSTIIHDKDEGIRYDVSLESITGVKLIMPDGVLSAASSSQICDGASAVLVVSEAALKQYNLIPIARVHNMTITAGDPVIMLEEPLFATEKALKKSGLTINDIDLYEVNEAFASVPLAWLKYCDADPQKLNVNGGAIALGHPLGASGAKLTATLINALRARGGRYGLQTMCEGGGVANVTIYEAL